jgi:hypothetical protein
MQQSTKQMQLAEVLCGLFNFFIQLFYITVSITELM